MPPKVSVLVPVFNGAPFLAECLESILAQDFAGYELLISDDRSTDGSPAIIEEFARRDPRIRWWRNPATLGLAANFNHCLRAATGDYVKFVLQDDKLMVPMALRRMVEVLDREESISLVASATQIIGARSELRKVRDAFLRSGVYGGRDVIIKCLERQENSVGEPSVVMFRRQHGLRAFNDQFRLLIDLEMWFHLLEQGDFAYIAEPLCAFRSHPQQESHACRRVNCHQTEYPQLLAGCLAKPWLRAAFSKDALFANIHSIRKWKNPKNSRLTGEFRQMLAGHWYALYWLKYKLAKPFAKSRVAGITFRKLAEPVR